MIRIRPYKPTDAGVISGWLPDEMTFFQWCAGKFAYPLTVEQLDDFARSHEGSENGWPMTALDDQGTPVGFFFLAAVDYAKGSGHLGFVVVDPARRGQGMGKQLMTGAVRYSFDILGLNRLTLCVFDNNPAAHACYRAIGFEDIRYDPARYTIGGQPWAAWIMAIENRDG